MPPAGPHPDSCRHERCLRPAFADGLRSRRQTRPHASAWRRLQQSVTPSCAAFSCLLTPWQEKAGEYCCGFFPFALFPFKLFSAGAGQTVELCLAVVIGQAPFGADRALLLEL